MKCHLISALTLTIVASPMALADAGDRIENRLGDRGEIRLNNVAVRANGGINGKE
tara:strand:+ start:175 stop:339 length:165 start_codon:yes stop_codon:yes gene_type:complete